MRGKLSDDAFVFLLLILLLIVLADRFRRLPRQRRGPVLTARTLRWHAYRRKTLITVLVAAGMSGLVLLSAYHGGVTYAAAAGSTAVFFAIAAVLLVPYLRVHRRPLHRALARCGGKLDALGVQHLQKVGALRFYVDDDWLICVGGGNSALLHAEEIDFSKPVQQRNYKWLMPGSRNARSVDICETVFGDPSGAEYPALLQMDAMLAAWVHRHGGRFDYEKARRKYGKKAKNK